MILVKRLFRGQQDFLRHLLVAFRISNLLERNLLRLNVICVHTCPDRVLFQSRTVKMKRTRLVRITCLLTMIFVGLFRLIGIIFALNCGSDSSGLFGYAGEIFFDCSSHAILFPFLLFIGRAALIMGESNSRCVFSIPALAPAMLYRFDNRHSYIGLLQKWNSPLPQLHRSRIGRFCVQFVFQIRLFKNGYSLKPEYDF